jgi:hypothetical protein
MTFSDFNAVAHDVNDFGNVPNQTVIIRSETVAKAILKPHVFDRPSTKKQSVANE